MGLRSAGLTLATGAVLTLAACSSNVSNGGIRPSPLGSAPTAGSTTDGAGPSTTASSTTASSTTVSSTTTGSATFDFVPIVEPFDPGHAASAKSGTSVCASATSTVGIEQCLENSTETADASIDATQAARFAAATPAARAAILADDAAWLRARGPVCSVAFNSGGSIDGINTATCLLAESASRLDLVKGITPPQTILTSTDNPDPSSFAWYTAPDGSRIAELDSQGDQTGGAIIAWMIVGGANGYVVHPGGFKYQDGTFVDSGIVAPASAAGHRVATGVEYSFSVDYTTLSKDPNGAKRTGGYVYAPDATPVAIWK